MARACRFCGASINHKRANARYCAKSCYHRSDDYKAAQKTYQQSEKGKAAFARVIARLNQESKKNRQEAKKNRVCVICGASIARKNAHAKYCSPRCSRKSPASKRAAATYAKSAKGKAVQKRYNESSKGKAVRNRAVELRKQRTDAQQGDTDGTMAIAQDLNGES